MSPVNVVICSCLPASEDRAFSTSDQLGYSTALTGAATPSSAKTVTVAIITSAPPLPSAKRDPPLAHESFRIDSLAVDAGFEMHMAAARRTRCAHYGDNFTGHDQLPGID